MAKKAKKKWQQIKKKYMKDMFPLPPFPNSFPPHLSLIAQVTHIYLAEMISREMKNSCCQDVRGEESEQIAKLCLLA